MIFYKKTPNGILLNIFVQPKASQNEIVCEYKNSLKIRLTNPPVDNVANKACIKFLAKELDIAKSDIEILKGEHSRQKRVLIKKIKIKELESFINLKS
ncbi:MAG: DUF167 domain-containing protein [bacterium]